MTHPQTFGGCMWLCWIIVCLLTIEGVKQRTPSLLPHNSGPEPPPSFPFQPSINTPPTGSQQTATSEEVLLVPCRRATKQALLSAGEHAGMNVRPNTASSLPLCLPFCVSPPIPPCLPLNSLPLFVFHQKESWNLSGLFFSISWPSACFQSPGVAEHGVIFQKNTGGLLGHGGWVEGREADTAGVMLCHVWRFSSFKPVGQSVSCQSKTFLHICPSPERNFYIFCIRENFFCYKMISRIIYYITSCPAMTTTYGKIITFF